MSLFFNEILAFEDVYTFFIYKIYMYIYYIYIYLDVFILCIMPWKPFVNRWKGICLFPGEYFPFGAEGLFWGVLAVCFHRM